MRQNRCGAGFIARKPIGWVMSLLPDIALTCQVLSMAFESRRRPKGLILQFDKDSHYTSREFHQQLWYYQIEQSMSRRGNCWDIAPLERFLRSLKKEWMTKLGYRSFAEAKCSVTDYLVGYYSHTRPHRHNRGLNLNTAEQLYWTDC